jgi:hypothetical protein
MKADAYSKKPSEEGKGSHHLLKVRVRRWRPRCLFVLQARELLGKVLAFGRRECVEKGYARNGTCVGAGAQQRKAMGGFLLSVLPKFRPIEETRHAQIPVIFA